MDSKTILTQISRSITDLQNLEHGFLLPCVLWLLSDTYQSDAMARLHAVTDILMESLWKVLREDHIERHKFVKTTEYCWNDLTPHRKQWWRERVEQVAPVVIHKCIHLFVWNNNTEEITIQQKRICLFYCSFTEKWLLNVFTPALKLSIQFFPTNNNFFATFTDYCL